MFSMYWQSLINILLLYEQYMVCLFTKVNWNICSCLVFYNVPKTTVFIGEKIDVC